MNSRGERRGLTIAMAVVVVAIAVVAALLVAMPSTHMVTVDVDGAGETVTLTAVGTVDQPFYRWSGGVKST